MKPSSRPTVCRAFVAAFVLAVLPIKSPVHGATADESATHEDLRKLKTVYENALNSGDLSPLEALFAANSSGVVVDNQSYRSYADLKSIYERFHASFPGVVYRIKLDPEPSLLFGDIAVTYGTADEYVKTAAGEFTYKSSFTTVLRREGNQWKLVRSQVTMDPFKSSIVHYFISQTKLYFGGGALLVGLFGGFIAGRQIARKKNATAAS